MKKYKVLWIERHAAEIEARSEEEASDIYASGDIDQIVSPSSSCISRQFDDIEEVEEKEFEIRDDERLH